MLNFQLKQSYIEKHERMIAVPIKSEAQLPDSPIPKRQTGIVYLIGLGIDRAIELLKPQSDYGKYFSIKLSLFSGCSCFDCWPEK